MKSKAPLALMEQIVMLLVFALAAKPMKKYYLGQDLAPAARGEA